MSAHIFIRNLTVVDCAVATKNHGVLGASFQVDVQWFGERDKDGIVVDFGDAKKIAKRVLDDEFDHRLFVEKNQTIEANEVEAGYAISRFVSTCGHLCSIAAPESHFVLLNSSEAIKKSSTQLNSSELTPSNSGFVFETSLIEELEEKFAAAILKKSPSQVSRVVVTVKEERFHNDEAHYSYTHSLQFHKGNCQRFHGHHNRVEVFNKNGKRLNEIEQNIATNMHGKYLIPSSYLSSESVDPVFSKLKTFATAAECAGSSSDQKSSPSLATEMAYVAYEGNQGRVWLMLPVQMIELMSVESTVENIASHLTRNLNRFCAGLDLQDAIEDLRVCAFEGISKGSLAQ